VALRIANAPWEQDDHGDWDIALIVVLLVTAALGAYHLDWGLPHGNASWAADALSPITVLGGAPLPGSAPGWRRDEIKSGRSGYRVAAVFNQEPRLFRSRITSLCPTITVYTRQ
jgi:hypothetical protein